VCYYCNVFSPFSGSMWKILLGRSWFSPRLGSSCFHVKIMCSHISIYFRCFTLSEHFTNSPSKQGLSLFPETAKICHHNSPPSCVCVLSNLTLMRVLDCTKRGPSCFMIDIFLERNLPQEWKYSCMTLGSIYFQGNWVHDGWALILSNMFFPMVFLKFKILRLVSPSKWMASIWNHFWSCRAKKMWSVWYSMDLVVISD